MKQEPDARTRRGIKITVAIVAGIAFMFYALFVWMHMHPK
jgi:hypothetical protein